MDTITEKLPDFKSFERIVFNEMCAAARDLMREWLERMDRHIMATRDTKEYRYHGAREATVKTVMGEVTYKRGYYRKRSGGHVALLDEAMGIRCGCGLASGNLAELVVGECAAKSYRKAAEGISACTGQPISAMGAWGILQRFGEAVGRREARLAELAERGKCGQLGNVPCRVLFEEFDDVWLATQRATRRGGRAAGGKDAKPRKGPGKKPMHVGISYTGWTPAGGGRYATADKSAYASFGDLRRFVGAFETLQLHRYDMDGVERVVANGDGAGWVRAVAEGHGAILQLDPYHRNTAIVEAVADKGDRKLLFDALGERDVGKALAIARGLAGKAGDEGARARLERLHGYLDANRDALLTWRERGLELPPPPDGVAYRDMGAQEPNNCSLITLRMKRRRGSWSESGGNNMARVLCLMGTIGLGAIMGDLPEPGPAERAPEPLSAADAPTRDGKGYGADWLRARMPYEGAARTPGREAIRGMLRLRPLSSLPFLQGS